MEGLSLMRLPKGSGSLGSQRQTLVGSGLPLAKLPCFRAPLHAFTVPEALFLTIRDNHYENCLAPQLPAFKMMMGFGAAATSFGGLINLSFKPLLWYRELAINRSLNI